MMQYRGLNLGIDVARTMASTHAPLSAERNMLERFDFVAHVEFFFFIGYNARNNRAGLPA